jgi:uncharacterized DUF497 family protein
MRFEWDPAKEAINRRKHGLTFGEVTSLFTSGVDYLEIPDVDHADDEDRLIAIGPLKRGVVLVVFTERHEDTIRIISARKATRAETALYRQYRGDHP